MVHERDRVGGAVDQEDVADRAELEGHTVQRRGALHLPRRAGYEPGRTTLPPPGYLLLLLDQDLVRVTIAARGVRFAADNRRKRWPSASARPARRWYLLRIGQDQRALLR